MKYKKGSTGEEKVQKIAAGKEGKYRMERVPPKADWQTSQIPGWGFVYKRQSLAVFLCTKKPAQVWCAGILKKGSILNSGYYILATSLLMFFIGFSIR